MIPTSIWFCPNLSVDKVSRSIQIFIYALHPSTFECLKSNLNVSSRRLSDYTMTTYGEQPYFLIVPLNAVQFLFKNQQNLAFRDIVERIF